MKRQLLASILTGTLAGALLYAPPATARPVDPDTTPSSAVTIPVDAIPIWVFLTPSAPAVTVEPGDTLTAIGVRTHRTWEQLAGFNHLSDPNLILPGQPLSIPPAGYIPPAGLYVSPAPEMRAVSSDSTVTYVTQPPGYGGGVWACIAAHESGSNPATNTGNGYYGAFQDTLGSWAAAGGPPGLPSDYSYAVQLAVNERIQQQQGWGAWPVTSRECGV